MEIRGVPKKNPDKILICCSTPTSSPLALLEQSKKVKVKRLLVWFKSAIGEDIGALRQMKILFVICFGHPVLILV